MVQEKERRDLGKDENTAYEKKASKQKHRMSEMLEMIIWNCKKYRRGVGGDSA